ncbi:MAG: hypothetical protein PHE58_05655, partial [Candidatus Omnitrophica bacterium]|nr:hypothetical protein [Candidatus Omnitrophota bacterium]
KNTYVLRPSWQGRRLGKAVVKVTGKKLVECAVEEVRVSDKIPDDKEVLSFLPQCFSDNACTKESMKGVCRNPGTMQSSCSFSRAKKIKVTVIRPRQCKTCDVNIQNVSRILKNHFPGMTMEFLSYPDSKSRKIISESGITHLPAYLLPKDVEGEPDFEIIRDKTDRKGNFFLLKPAISGLSYYLGRKKTAGKFDLFISLYDRSSADVLAVVRAFNPSIHFLAVEQKDGFEAAKGTWEIEDDLRAVCVQKYYPQYFWDYLTCRAKSIGSSWWEDCLPSPMDPGIIKKCARCDEGKGLLRANIALTQELKLMFGPAYLVDNQEIFMSQGAPNKDELKRVINGK